MWRTIERRLTATTWHVNGRTTSSKSACWRCHVVVVVGCTVAGSGGTIVSVSLA
jgi:hypothetical protein